MTLKYDPYQIFRGSTTPAGLYARQKWLKEDNTDQWRLDFEEAVTSLVASQSADGAWQQSTGVTIDYLFALHLTLRSREPVIDKALNWLLEKVHLQEARFDGKGNDISIGKPLAGLPFVSSQPAILTAAATLFLASIFGRVNDRVVQARYKWFIKKLIRSNGTF